MTGEQAAVAAILLGAIGMFAWGRWRHDMVALGALLAAVGAGVVPAGDAFAGFGHPAVITVACVLVLSRGLAGSGAVDALANRVLPKEAGAAASIAALTGLVASLSAFMNNVGALALVMPLALRLAARLGIAPGQVLMPLAFGSMLGGMTTLIGTPPNLVVSAFRMQAKGEAFAMFDFAPVGLAVAAAGIAFMAPAARLLVPARPEAGIGSFDTAAYLTEVRVPEGAKAVGMTVAAVEEALDGVEVAGVLRQEAPLHAASAAITLRAGDILQIEAEAQALAAALAELGLVLEEAVSPKREGQRRAAPALVELVVLPGARLAGRSATDIALRSRYGVNLLALSREGRRTRGRLRSAPLLPGDVLLMQGEAEAIAGFAADYGCVPLAERSLVIPDPRRRGLAVALMLGAVAAAASGLVPPAIAFAAAVLGAMATDVVPPRAVYGAIDWPVIVLLGALMPVADAVASTGLAARIAETLLAAAARGDAAVALAVLLVVTMTLSDVVNNTATAAVMCPIALGAARALGVSADPFLMAVAIGSSCAFLTPIGHQNNTLILGPGGFRFGDYWRLGLPLEVVVVAVSLPLILAVWPP
jgi:di/tricarboxylate transporter